MSTEPPSKVFIIDDDPSVRKGLSRLLGAAGYTVESFPSASDFLAYSPHRGPCCIVLDLQLPGLNGLALQETLFVSGRDEPIVFITGHGDIETCAGAMKAGAVDFLPKPFRNEDLLTAVARSLERSKRRFRERVERAKIQALIDRLTPREYEVMELVIAGKLNKQIAAHLGASEKTVKVHRGRMMQKMEVFSVAELVRLVERQGIGAER